MYVRIVRFSSSLARRPTSHGSKKFLGVVIFLITFALSDTPYLTYEARIYYHSRRNDGISGFAHECCR